MSLPRLNRDYTISKLACQLLGSLSPNSRDLVVQVKDAWVASGWWAVTRSCDGTTIASSDLWADYTDLQGLGGSGGYSWLTIRNSATGVNPFLRNVSASAGTFDFQTYRTDTNADTDPASGSIFCITIYCME